MYALDDHARFAKVLVLDVPWAHSYADMRPGKTDRERRENYRAAAIGKLQSPPPNVLWWAFRITVHKSGRALDVDNVAKTIVDSFCARQISWDKSDYGDLALYPDDSFEYVRILQVIGVPSMIADSTRIEIFACVQDHALPEP